MATTKLDALFEQEEEISEHLQKIGILLLDVSDSTKDSLTREEFEEVKDHLTEIDLNCKAIIDDLEQGRDVLKKARTKHLTVYGRSFETRPLKKQFEELKEDVERLQENNQKFLSSKEKDKVFRQMNESYSKALEEITSLLAMNI